MYYSSCELLEESQSNPFACMAGCCVDLNAPNQPTDRTVIDLTNQQIGNKSEYWCLNPQWYKGFPWIHLRSAHEICLHCLSAYKKGIRQQTRHFEVSCIGLSKLEKKKQWNAFVGMR